MGQPMVGKKRWRKQRTTFAWRQLQIAKRADLLTLTPTVTTFLLPR